MIAAALAEQGVAIPAELASIGLWPTSVPFRTAFRVLSAARSRGQFGPLALAYTEIAAYAMANGFAHTQIELEEFVQFVQAQDAVYLEETVKRLASKVKR